MFNELKQYENKKPIAAFSITNTVAMYIMDINDEYVIIKGFTKDLHKYKLKQTKKGFYFTYCNGCRYYINDFMRCNYDK